MLNAFGLINMNRLQSVLYWEWNPPLLLLELFTAASHSFLQFVSRLSQSFCLCHMLLGNCDASDASSVTKQHFNSNPVQLHLCPWEKRQEKAVDSSVSRLVSFSPGFSLHLSYSSFQCKLNIFSLFEVSFSAKVHRLFSFSKVGMECINYSMKLEIMF